MPLWTKINALDDKYSVVSMKKKKQSVNGWVVNSKLLMTVYEFEYGEWKAMGNGDFAQRKYIYVEYTVMTMEQVDTDKRQR